MDHDKDVDDFLESVKSSEDDVVNKQDSAKDSLLENVSLHSVECEICLTCMTNVFTLRVACDLHSLVLFTMLQFCKFYNLDPESLKQFASAQSRKSPVSRGIITSLFSCFCNNCFPPNILMFLLNREWEPSSR